MIIIRRIKHTKQQASFGFPNPFTRIQEVNRESGYAQRMLQKDLNKAKSQGKNLRDPTVLKQVMQPTAQRMKARTGKISIRNRRTKGGKIVTERVRR